MKVRARVSGLSRALKYNRARGLLHFGGSSRTNPQRGSIPPRVRRQDTRRTFSARVTSRPTIREMRILGSKNIIFPSAGLYSTRRVRADVTLREYRGDRSSAFPMTNLPTRRSAAISGELSRRPDGFPRSFHLHLMSKVMHLWNLFPSRDKNTGHRKIHTTAENCVRLKGRSTTVAPRSASPHPALAFATTSLFLSLALAISTPIMDAQSPSRLDISVDSMFHAGAAKRETIR